jgi:drug/metabolite transporter (DMT)-like permease
MAALLAAVILKEAFTSQKTAGLALIVLGAIGIVWISGGSVGTMRSSSPPGSCGLVTLSLCGARGSRASMPPP